MNKKGQSININLTFYETLALVSAMNVFDDILVSGGDKSTSLEVQSVLNKLNKEIKQTFFNTDGGNYEKSESWISGSMSIGQIH